MDIYIIFKTEHVLAVLFLIQECEAFSFMRCKLYMFSVDLQHPGSGVERQVSALKSQRIDRSNRESVKYQEKRGEFSLIISGIPSIHSFAVLSRQPNVITVMHISHSCLPHNPQQYRL